MCKCTMWFMQYMFLIFSLIYVVESRVFRYDYKYNEESEVWLKLHKEKRTWHDARKMCHLEGATLASPLDEYLTNAINLIRNYYIATVYVGVHATFSPGVWQSVEGIPLARFADNMFQKDFDSSERQCAVLDISIGLSSVACSEQHQFFCYKRDPEVPHITACGTIDRDYELDNRTGSCYKFHRVAQPWTKAYEICSAEGAYLAIINSDTESQVLKELFHKNKHSTVQSEDINFVGVGFLDWQHNREWYTVHGDRLEDSGYTKWANGEPTNKLDNEFCGTINGSGGLNDFECRVKTAFICEKNVKSLDIANNTLEEILLRK